MNVKIASEAFRESNTSNILPRDEAFKGVQ